MNNQWTLKRKRDVLKAYFMIFVMFLFLFSPAFSLNSYEIVFAEDDTPAGEEDSSSGDTEDDDGSSGVTEDSDDSGSGTEDGDGSGDVTEANDVSELATVKTAEVKDPFVSGSKCDGDIPADPKVDLANTEGVDYAIEGEVKAGETVRIVATAQEGYELRLTGDWDFDGDQAILVIKLPAPDCGEGGEMDGKVLPIMPEIVDSICDGDGTITQPNLMIDHMGEPTETGVLYGFLNSDGSIADLENLSPGQTVEVIATPKDRYEGENLELYLLTGWTDLGNGSAMVEITFDDPDCEGEVGDGDEKVVTPIAPIVTHATCDAGGKVTKPSVDTFHHGAPNEVGILYDFVGEIGPENMEAGDTVRVVAAPYDRYEGEGLELEIPEGWTEVDNGWAEIEIELVIPDCDEEGDVLVGSGEIITIDRDGCIVSITTSLSEGKYVLEVWDDGMKIDEVTKTVTEVGEHVFTWEITEPAMESAPGVGFFLKDENGSDLDMVDPFEYPVEVADKCGGVTKDDSDMGEADVLGQGGPAVVSTDDTGHVLPSTATPLFNLLVIGFVLLTLGGLNLLLFRARKT